MISVYCKADKEIREKLGKKWQICEFLYDGLNTNHHIRFVNDLPINSYRVSKRDFTQTYINAFLFLNGMPGLYKDEIELTQNGVPDFAQLSELDQLIFALKQAESTENFKLAAELRDKINKLENGK